MPNKLPTYERRTGDPHLQPATIDPEGIVTGYPIVFNQRTRIGDMFDEEIDAHALDAADLSDIVFAINHDDAMLPLARHRRGRRSTMDVTIDGHGLAIEARLDKENNVNSRALISAVERGDVEDMSFAFGVEIAGDEWSDLDKPIPFRRITKIRKVFEVSAVNVGAYPQTSINARSAAALENEKRALENARAAALENEKTARLALEKEKFKFLSEVNKK